VNKGDAINGKWALKWSVAKSEIKADQKKRKWLHGLFLITLYSDMKQSQHRTKLTADLLSQEEDKSGVPQYHTTWVAIGPV